MDLFSENTPTGKLLRDMWRDIQLANDKRAVEAAKADPEKHKLSKLMPQGVRANYTYMNEPVRAVGGRARRKVWWCWATNANIAGYYLSWRQVETRRTVKRTQFKAHKHKYLGQQRAEREIKKVDDLRH